MSPPRRTVAVALLLMGGLDLCALLVAIVPVEWIAVAHAAIGMGSFPVEPVAEYLARTGSLMYALHGATIVYIARDVDRYWGLIRFLAICALVHGALIAAIDSGMALPAWWRFLEGPAFSATGVIVLFLQWRADRSRRGETDH